MFMEWTPAGGGGVGAQTERKLNPDISAQYGT